MIDFRFKLVRQKLYEEWDREWLREVRGHAPAVVVRIPGICHFDRIDALQAIGEDDERAKSYERAMIAFNSCRHTACVFLFPAETQLPNWANPMEKWQGCGIITAQHRWCHTAWLDRFHERLAYMLNVLRHSYAGKIVVHAEDFAARWMMLSGFRPDVWLLENPIIGHGEALDLWPKMLQYPAAVRRGSHWRFKHFRYFGIHLKSSELIFAGLPERGRLGDWTKALGVIMRKQIRPLSEFIQEGQK